MLAIYQSNINSYEAITGKSLAMFLLKDNNKIYLLRGTTASPYMSEQLKKDVADAIELGFNLLEIADLFDKTESLELLGTSLEIFQRFANDKWNWYKWSFNKNFQYRFWTHIKKGVVLRNV